MSEPTRRWRLIAPEPTRAEHLAWCKARAIEYIDAGQVHKAFTSFVSDIGKHPETASHMQFITLIGMPELMSGRLDDPAEMRRFIEGFA